MTPAQTETTFPLDWDAWRTQWSQWKNANDLKAPRQNPWAGKHKNFLADSILGRYALPDGRIVELSEVTFPNLSERDARGNLIHAEYRYIGLTFADGTTDLVRTFADLDSALGL